MARWSYHILGLLYIAGVILFPIGHIMGSPFGPTDWAILISMIFLAGAYFYLGASEKDNSYLRVSKISSIVLAAVIIIIQLIIMMLKGSYGDVQGGIGNILNFVGSVALIIAVVSVIIGLFYKS